MKALIDTNVVAYLLFGTEAFADEARACLEQVETATLCQGALLRAIESGVSADDTLFVELAVRSACQLATFDKAVLKAFSEVARRPESRVSNDHARVPSSREGAI